MNTNEYYIKRCIEIARNGLGTTRPNPMVGCVIVHNNEIIAEGFTSPYGGNHAEVNAINSVKDKTILKASTLYVTLEPCSHYGKTPPCSDLIIKYQIPKVVIGCTDDNPKVAGKGIQRLKASGCDVTFGILENECKTHHKRFFTFHNKQRPYIILKWAETSNGFIAPKLRERVAPVWITNKYSRQLVHKWRAEEHAILIGTTSVIKDDPSLTVRDWIGENPIRVVIDKDQKLSKSLNIFNNKAKTLTIVQKDKYESDLSTQQNILRGINWNDTTHIASQISNALYNENIQSIIIEGGSKTLQTFINEGLWDEARVFTGNVQFKEGIRAPKFSGNLISEKLILDDTLRTYYNH